ncbi:SapC family protein [Paraglaciecola aquimarina]|uniref:SapC family protein n=1 Tax=Paraglaciecola algarum TaxID=3050085 RepID=A0ABS9D285_9ALTE|nr:SapC family protein [Paraglaciecola sp. G1-23]MCF2946986.1 SapC family protein [Paraglaciecola sp. G1-23]
MSKFTILDPKQHKDLQVITDRDVTYGDNHHFVPVLADELRALVAEYPVCFLKDNQTGKLGISALTGFEQGENLYLQDKNWQARYIPLHVYRQPFMVGIQGNDGEQATQDNTVVTIDLASSRVNKKEGQALFDDNGNATPYLEKISQALAKLVHGSPRTEQFIQALLDNDLIMPIQLAFPLSNGEKKSFNGIYNIDEEKLASLSGEALQSFHKKGYLQACHLILASFGQIQKLIDWKNNQ